jgi:N utilization substance protein B
MGGKVLSRRQSRRKAFELLFELEQHATEQPDTILERTFANPDVQELYLDDEDDDGYVAGVHDEVSQLYISELVLAVTEHEQELDTELAKYPHEWSFDRIGVPERILLRLAVAEMVYLGTSYKVVINEALDLAKLYAQDEARKFINGILGSVVNNLDELKQAHAQEGSSE